MIAAPVFGRGTLAMKPSEINQFLQRDLIGQEETLRYVSVAIFKHLQGEKFGNLLLIGNSGTGKTTIMRAVERLYSDTPAFSEFRVVIILNAHTLATEEGVVDTHRLFAQLEERARQVLGPDASADEIGRAMERATVCIDTGHHAPSTNIEFIVAFLLRQNRLGAFDFNSRFYADDDLMVGAADPFQLFRIMYEIVRAGALDPAYGIAFMLDQCHNIERKIPAIIRSVMNVQEATAKALLVDRDALTAAQLAGDVLEANAVLMDAYNTDVRPLLAEVRADAGLDPDPVGAYKRSGYDEKIIAERVGGEQAGWGA